VLEGGRFAFQARKHRLAATGDFPYDYKLVPRSAGKCRIRHREGQKDVRK
jgi:hypothetical protein